MSRSSAGVGGLVVANVLITIVRIYDDFNFIEAVLDGPESRCAKYTDWGLQQTCQSVEPFQRQR